MTMFDRPTRRTAIAGIAAATAARGSAGPVAAAPPPPMLWYRQPAAAWTEALPVGNGVLGAMVFGGTAQERLQLNEGTLWAGGPYDPVNPRAKETLPQVRALIVAGRFAEAQKLADEGLVGRPIKQMPYQALGDLTLDFPNMGTVSDYRRELDLDAAVATTRFTANGAAHLRRVVASPGDRVIAVRLGVTGGPGLDVDIALSSPHVDTRTVAAGADALLLTGANGASSGIAARLRFAARASLQVEGGQVEAVDGKLRVRGARAVTILIAMATSYRGPGDIGGDPAALTAAMLKQATRRRFARIAADTSARHRRLFRRVAIDLGTTAAAADPTDVRIRASQERDDPALAALYFHYGRYLLISCSQPGGQPATLQGLWNDSLDPPWGAKYTININTEMNYWPAHSANLGECVEPLVRMVRELAVTGAHTARTMYGARGWVAHHNIDLWRGAAPVDGAQWGMWPTGGAWLCTHLWEHYDYTRDLAYLRAVYPLLAGAARFFLDTLQVDPTNGHLVTNPSLSPENTHPFGATLCAGPTMDMAILRDLFEQTAAAATLLGQDAAMVAELRAARARLAPFKIGAQGQLQEWQEDWDAAAPEQDHRHVSHLYGVYPSHQISVEATPALAAAAKRTLETRGDRTTGWAIAWRINLWVRLRDGERAHRVLRLLLAPERTYPNMFDAHPPFQIDGNFGGTAAIVEMVMLSRDDVIELLPALPAAWPTGQLTGLRARGACGVDVSWRDGALAQVVLRPDRDGRRTVRLGTRRCAVRLRAGRAVTLRPGDFT